MHLGSGVRRMDVHHDSKLKHGPNLDKRPVKPRPNLDGNPDRSYASSKCDSHWLTDGPNDVVEVVFQKELAKVFWCFLQFFEAILLPRKSNSVWLVCIERVESYQVSRTTEVFLAPQCWSACHGRLEKLHAEATARGWNGDVAIATVSNHYLYCWFVDVWRFQVLLVIRLYSKLYMQ